MADTRHKNINWSIPADLQGGYNWEAAQLAVLMDLRDELQELNTLLHCKGFQRLPLTIQRIDTRLAKKIRLKR